MRSVVVTGATRGIGLAIAQRLRADGLQVITIGRSAIPGAPHHRPFDLADIDGLAALVKEIRGAFGPIWGLVNNAAIGTSGLLATLHEAQIERMVRLNTLSPLILSKHVVRAMLAAGTGGRIVNISSIVATTGFTGLSAYGATKAALVGMTRSLARELGPAGITVNAVAPGFVDTAMTQGLSATQRAQILRRSALGRPAQSADVGAAVAFLMGDAAASITGTVLTIDAGETA